METLRTLAALSIVASCIGFWIYKSRHYLLLTPFFAPLVISVLYLCSAYWIYFNSSSFWGLFVAFALPQLVCNPLHPVLNRIDLAVAQSLRDQNAAEVFNSGLAIPFALYLRPFKVTDRLNFSGVSAKWGGVDLESLIANACRPWGLLLGLGREGDAVGAGKLCCSDDDWKEMFFQLSEAAKSIIVVPGISGGSFYEIKYILSRGLLGKTTFLMPPKTLLRMSDRSFSALTTDHDPTEHDYSKEWEDVRIYLQAMGIMLPLYDRCGSLIQFHGNEGMFSQYKFETGVPSVKHVLAERLSHPAQ
ncbi:hypothetical protein [Pseudomonas fluorescens]|uniref:Uncharacterized protein n=1 Tax=Pseudomonas fluorescens TaxID=294 RepID=A0A0F4V6C9_PSEFL|nr:hypothetical protein [Pseudomonas fluorescens]KJZ64361.1 hypothetical protein VD17_17920 [Pseudomonas fluorescens]